MHQQRALVLLKNHRFLKQPSRCCGIAVVAITAFGACESTRPNLSEFYKQCCRYVWHRQKTDNSNSSADDESVSHRFLDSLLNLAPSWHYTFHYPSPTFFQFSPAQWPSTIPLNRNFTGIISTTFSPYYLYLDLVNLLNYYHNHYYPLRPNQMMHDLTSSSFGISSQNRNQLILASSPNTDTITSKTISSGIYVTKALQSALLSIPRHVTKFMQTVRDIVLVAIRATEIGVILSPFLFILGPASTLMASSTLSSSQPQHSLWLSQKIESAMWSYLLYTIPMLGPAFVKLTQWAATRRDLFSSKICDQLSTIQTSNPVVHSWAHTDHVLREALGNNYSQYLRIQHPTKESILGSGCVAQVYRGELLIPSDDYGENDDTTCPNYGGSNVRAIPVAIKVLHPHISEKIDRDLTFMKRIAHLLDSLLPTTVLCAVNIPRVVEHFEDIIRRQVDLRIEAHNLRKFHTNFPNTSTATTNTGGYSPLIEFPKPLIESKNVLVEELIAATDDIVEEKSLGNDTFSTSLLFFLNGGENRPQQQQIIKKTTTVRPITSFIEDNSKEGLLIRKQLARPLLQTFLKMLFKDNFVHCDLHAGNVFVKTTTTTTTITSPGKEQLERERITTQHYTIIFLDAGIATSLSPQGQANLRDLFRAVVLNDGETAGRLMVERARYERCSQIEGGVEAFSKGISDIVAEFHDHRKKKGLTLGAVRIGELLGKVLDLCRLYGVEIDPSMSSVVLSTVILEGLGRSLEPNLNLMEFAIPFLVNGYSIKSENS